MNRRIDKLVVELGICGVQDAKVVPWHDIEVGLDLWDGNVGLELDGQDGKLVNVGLLLVVDVGDGVLARVECGRLPERGLLCCLTGGEVGVVVVARRLR